MREIAAEASLAAPEPWGAQPVSDAHNTAWLLLIVAEDNIRAFETLVTAPVVSTFAHMVVGRAALETLGRACWLSVVDLGAERRVARLMSERLFSSREMLKLPLEDRAKVGWIRDGLTAQAETLGLKKVHDKHTGPAFVDRRKGNTEIVRWLLESRTDDDGVGETLYRYYASVSHATLDGIAQSVHVDPQVGIERPAAAMFTASASVRALTSALVLGYTAVTDRLIELFGWPKSETYAEAWTAALRTATMS